ncbi:MAG: M48 family metallopeptidase [Methylibium sp.]|uniref:M48 family metallopeptidase n=1 Tax=Methylibium sp. TaxID=2067992 RepID=UPI0018033315|nr:SprT family zinc-dependent metalloprotease [Methylibium sp.]MBA3598173.1 M48 family metallopeptidase [Methylibium sp.]
MTRPASSANPRQLDLPWFAADGMAVAALNPPALPLARPPAPDGLRQSSEALLLAPLPSASEVAPAAPVSGPTSAGKAQGGAPTQWRHPRAAREIDLGRAVVAYEFQRARRRSIGMVVSAEGLSVRAPRWVGWGEIEAALREKAGWIEAKLAEQHDRARKHAASRIEWRDGTALPFLGETVTVVLDPHTTGAVLDAGAKGLPGAPRLTLRVGLPQRAAPEQIRDVVQAWLKRQARRVFEERCTHFAPLLRVRISRLTLSSAQTRWGSASADGSIRLNWRLIHFALTTIDYVVAHELAHLREMNHSPRFWDVVRSVIPDIDGARGTLRHETLPAFD